MDNRHNDYIEIQKRCPGIYTNFIAHPEASEYNGCEYKYNNQRIIQRKSKITPKRDGQFVTLWRRNLHGVTCPFDKNDCIDYVIIIYEVNKTRFYLTYTKDELLKEGIFTGIKQGKRGFRIKPNDPRIKRTPELNL